MWTGIGQSPRNTPGDAARCHGETIDDIVPDGASALLSSNEADMCCLQLGLFTQREVGEFGFRCPLCLAHRETSCRRVELRDQWCEATSCGDGAFRVVPVHWSIAM